MARDRRCHAILPHSLLFFPVAISRAVRVKAWIISDTHNHHLQLSVPVDVDLVVHCGDESDTGDLALNAKESQAFFEWYSALSVPNKIFVPGNHSIAIEQGLINPADFPKIQFLIHAETRIEGWRIFGSPFTPEFFNWAYMKTKRELANLWQSIPQGIDLLITHGPPKGIKDLTHDMANQRMIHVGCPSLARHVRDRISPRLHAFGHIHDESDIGNFGTKIVGDTMYANCACCDLEGRIQHNGIIVDLEELPA